MAMASGYPYRSSHSFSFSFMGWHLIGCYYMFRKSSGCSWASFILGCQSPLLMTDLIAFISSGKGTVAHVHKVIEGQPWEQIFILATEESKGEVPKNNAIHLVIFDPRRTLPELVADFKSALKDKVKMMESAVNIIS